MGIAAPLMKIKVQAEVETGIGPDQAVSRRISSAHPGLNLVAREQLLNSARGLNGVRLVPLCGSLAVN